MAEQQAREIGTHALSRLINSSENVRHQRFNARFFIQNIDLNDPEKKIPSTAAKATRRSAKVQRWSNQLSV
jgi:hypothetical protein